ncbi:hypothetical protein E2C01_056005 [Portunus trituberculatus]|uniref:Uncharacterized protein n=1 Tax=Portunus trituberculatus TaxID=210409 RepID=A0A5B7GYH0_PORTR|nr:hypothetical protein [Portunus trituberculatus]
MGEGMYVTLSNLDTLGTLVGTGGGADQFRNEDVRACHWKRRDVYSEREREEREKMDTRQEGEGQVEGGREREGKRGREERWVGGREERREGREEETMEQGI